MFVLIKKNGTQEKWFNYSDNQKTLKQEDDRNT